MADFPRRKFFYKLCMMIKGKPYCFMNKNIEFSVGKSLTQDINDPSPYLYVYKTPELAVSNEIFYSSKDFITKLSEKTVVKIMC
jgi:hypothetical protein